MISTRWGIKIKFIKLDSFVVQMEVSIPGTKGDVLVAAPKFTIDQLQEELSILENTKAERVEE